MPTDAPIVIRLAQTLGITSSLLLGGISLGFSAFTVPRLLESPTPLMLRQWKKMYIAGRNFAIPCAFLSSLSFFYLAYSTHSSNPFSGSGDAVAYAVAGALSIGIIPVTLVVLLPTNNKLERKEEEVRGLEKEDEVVEGLGEETAHVLVDRWATLNLWRVGMVITASVIGIWTSISN
jgi:Anthrone oxygenase